MQSKALPVVIADWIPAIKASAVLLLDSSLQLDSVSEYSGMCLVETPLVDGPEAPAFTFDPPAAKIAQSFDF